MAKAGKIGQNIKTTIHSIAFDPGSKAGKSKPPATYTGNES